eukprot:scaffold18976_cov145-Skeletonema_marinoi.AAC.1
MSQRERGWMLMANNLVYFLTVLTIYFLLRPHNGSMKRFKESPFKKLQVIIRSLDAHPTGLIITNESQTIKQHRPGSDFLSPERFE